MGNLLVLINALLVFHFVDHHFQKTSTHEWKRHVLIHRWNDLPILPYGTLQFGAFEYHSLQFHAPAKLQVFENVTPVK